MKSLSSVLLPTHKVGLKANQKIKCNSLRVYQYIYIYICNAI